MPKKLGSKALLKAYLRKRVGKTLTSRELQEAAGGAVQYARRIRELRAEGWKISTHNDLDSLKPGEYRLEEEPPKDSDYVFPPSISSKVRAQVLERNGYTCQMCGAGAGELDERGRKVRLQMGHIVAKSHGGTDDISNLKALCSTCNEGAKNLTQEPPRWAWLLSQIRRASKADQKKAYEWLQERFSSEKGS